MSEEQYREMLTKLTISGLRDEEFLLGNLIREMHERDRESLRWRQRELNRELTARAGEGRLVVKRNSIQAGPKAHAWELRELG